MPHDFNKIKDAIETLDRKRAERDQVARIHEELCAEVERAEAQVKALIGLSATTPNAMPATPNAPAKPPKLTAPLPNPTYRLHPRFKVASISDDQLQQWLDQGYNTNQIAQHLGVTWGAVHSRLKNIKSRAAH